jgi:hypothetical protein
MSLVFKIAHVCEIVLPNLMSSRFFYAVANVRISFFFKAGNVSLHKIVYISFIHPFIDIIRLCLTFGSCEYYYNECRSKDISLSYGFISFEYIPRTWIVGSFIFNFLRNLHTVSHNVYINLNPINNEMIKIQIYSKFSYRSENRERKEIREGHFNS